MIDLKKVKRMSSLTPEAQFRERRKKRLDKMISKGTMNLKMAKVIMKNSDIPGLEPVGNMFYFKGKYYYVSNGKIEKPSEYDVQNMLAGENKIDLHLICADKVCPMPDAFHLMDVKGHKVKDDDEAAKIMSEISGITIKKSDL